MSEPFTDEVAEGRALAGALLEERWAGMLRPSAFSGVKFRDAASKILALHGRGEAVTPFSVAKELGEPEAEAMLEGIAARFGCLSAGAAIKEINQLHTRREVISLCERGYNQAADASTPTSEVIHMLEADVLTIAADGSTRAAKDGSNFSKTQEDFEWRLANPGKIRGIPTGFGRLDTMLDGLKGGKSYLIGARPGIGKSALAKDITESLLLQGKRVLTFSLEMDAEECQSRMLSSVSGIPIGANRKYTQPEIDKVNATAKRLSLVDWEIDDTPGLMVDEFRAKCRAAYRKEAIDLIVVDYIQLMRGSTERSRKDRRLEVGEISACMKNVSRELDVPLLSLAQLKRATGEKFNPSTGAYETPLPTISDLKESGDLEQDADGVILIHRADSDSLILAKNRGGPTGIIDVRWVPTLTKFEPL